MKLNLLEGRGIAVLFVLYFVAALAVASNNAITQPSASAHKPAVNMPDQTELRFYEMAVYRVEIEETESDVNHLHSSIGKILLNADPKYRANVDELVVQLHSYDLRELAKFQYRQLKATERLSVAKDYYWRTLMKRGMSYDEFENWYLASSLPYESDKRAFIASQIDSLKRVLK